MSTEKEKAFEAVLRWIEGEFRVHVFDDVEYRKMMVDTTYGESYKLDVTIIRAEKLKVLEFLNVGE